VYIGTNNNSLLGLDADTGTVLWKHGDPYTGSYGSSPAVVDGSVYIGTDHPGEVRAYRIGG
jgi:outer membrane protein assembly factor BamB